MITSLLQHVLPGGRERGQILMIAALLLPVLLGMAGMAVDIGTYSADRRALQNAADSMALAAGQELPNASAAEAAAIEYAAEHNIDVDDVTVTVSGGNTEPSVRVVIERMHDWVFMGAVGIDDAEVGAVAAAGKFSPGAGEGIVPWSITQATVDSSASGDEVVIKYDSNGGSNGNFGAIRIDGNGSTDYEDAAKYGSNYHICSTGMSNCTTGGCPAAYPNNCAEDSPECDGPQCPPKTGNMTGPTENAVDFRMGNTSSACDTFDEAFDLASALHQYEGPDFFAGGADAHTTGGRLSSPPQHHGQGSHETFTPTPVPPTNTPAPPTNTPAATNTPGPTSTPGPTDTPGPAPTSTNTTTPGGGPKFSLNPHCNPWSGGSCSSHTAICSRRIFLIPIIDSFGNGSSDPVTIQGFALMYLEGFGDTCTGSECEIRARFVKADVTTGSFAADYDPDSLNHFVRLTE